VSPVVSAARRPARRRRPRTLPGSLHLTFDDGPDATWTAQVLDELDRCRARATFFMVGERALERPDLVRAVLDAGHGVELHCHRHIRHTELSERELERDAQLGLAALERAGARPGLWRAPWGVLSEASPRVAERFALRLVGWSIDTHDWRGDDPRTMLARARGKVADGSTVLMHDALGPGALRHGCKNTISLLSGLTAAAREHGLSPVPMFDRIADLRSRTPTRTSVRAR
jgi:peptidoglycan-N-acetylglucosamine deacetylase